MGNTSSSRINTYEDYYKSIGTTTGATRSSNKPIDINNLDPYEVLGVRKNFDWEELKSSYKRLARLVHPDKGGNEEMFNAVTECFRKLAHEYKARQEKSHDELRKGSREYAESYVETSKDMRSVMEERLRGGGGNDSASFQERFNRVFDENKYDEDDGTSHNSGYADKMAASTGKVREDFNIPQVMKKYDNNTFNKVFDSVTLAPTTEIIKYREPEALPVAKSLQYTELGKSKTDDFSSTTEGEARKSLQYTDYMKAYTTTRLVDPRAVDERRKYRNVDEYESARTEVMSKPVSEEERKWRKQKEMEAERAEKERQYRLRERDNRLALQHDKVSRLMIGGK
jgi:curved DNA-binding protein CbpA